MSAAVLPQTAPAQTPMGGLATAVGGQAPAILSQRLVSDPYADHAALLQLWKDQSAEMLDQRWMFERSWWRNLLYLLGRQWIYFDVRRAMSSPEVDEQDRRDFAAVKAVGVAVGAEAGDPVGLLRVVIS